MSTIYETFVERVAAGSKFNVDFKKRSIRTDRNYLVEDGNYVGDPITEVGDFVDTLNKLYENYAHSAPSARNDGKGRRYFKALKQNELTDADLAKGEERELAQAKLEGYILCAMLAGLKWPFTGWFWKGESGIVLLKEWFE